MKESDILILDPASSSIKSRAGSTETYTYLNSRTLSTIAAGEYSNNSYIGNYVCCTTESGGAAFSVTSTVSGEWKVTIPADYKVLCYDTPGSAINSDYRKPRTKAYTLTCTQKATLSNGNVRYYYTTPDNRGFWFDFISTMSVAPLKSYTVTFDACGGNVGEKERMVPSGSALESLPVPTRPGYTFLGWCNSNGASGLMVNSENYRVNQDVTLYAWWAKEPEETEQKTGHWGPWSKWTTKSYTASDTRQVEAKEVQTAAVHTEYRYGRYIDQTGTHNCWCGKYLESLSYVSGKAKLDYTKWSATRYSASGSEWTCGQCGGKHKGVDHVDSAGRPIWVDYRISGKPYYWEESRTVEAQYETQYRYRDWISD